MITEGPITVLIVDDDTEVCNTYEMYFRGERFRTRVAQGGPEALLKVDDDVDIVLLDRRMPEVSGDEVLEFIRDWNLDCRVIMVTAVNPDTSIIEMEFDGYLTKPVSKSELLSTVKQQVLFERYQTLFERYQTATRKHALLAAQDVDDEELRELTERRETLKQRLENTVDAFDNEMVKETLADLHQSS
ncbi:Response regulator receiver domain-containing protein [Halovenus aranensis]|jgi:DNA-binding response OmpR family regulator|uniref:Response regulator receiver domain-containing protein n=1 Tax=Halovenus aranensis TaxID=890420 RepID=A0A1G8XR58_9EURY|nr:response regulator [Halovenus aranensis]SDJ92385.1 Response regulator receiver domain-containing protein [Halovenus aranensis]